MTSSIRGARFAPCDDTALELFLKTAPSGADIKRFLAEAKPEQACFRSFFDAPSYTASYVTAWRRRVAYLTALRVTAAQAAGIESRMGYAGAWSWTTLPGFQDCVEAAIGGSVNPGYPRGSYLARWWRPEVKEDHETAGDPYAEQLGLWVA